MGNCSKYKVSCRVIPVLGCEVELQMHPIPQGTPFQRKTQLYIACSFMLSHIQFDSPDHAANGYRSACSYDMRAEFTMFEQ